MNELNYQAIHRYTHNLSKEYEKHKCDPRAYHIGYCVDYQKEDCPKTCEYAVGIERKVNEDSQ